MTLERWIKPGPGRRVRFPGTGKLLSEAGQLVPWGSYWERLRQAGDVVVFDGPVQPQPGSTPAPKPSASVSTSASSASTAVSSLSTSASSLSTSLSTGG